MKPLPGDDEDLLRQIGDVLGSIHPPAAKDSLDPAARCAVQLIKRLWVASLGRLDECQKVWSITRRADHGEMLERGNRITKGHVAFSSDLQNVGPVPNSSGVFSRPFAVG